MKFKNAARYIFKIFVHICKSSGERQNNVLSLLMHSLTFIAVRKSHDWRPDLSLQLNMENIEMVDHTAYLIHEDKQNNSW